MGQATGYKRVFKLCFLMDIEWRLIGWKVGRVGGDTKVINHLRGKLRNDIKSGGVSEGCLSLRTNSSP